MKAKTASHIIETYVPNVARATDPRFDMQLAEEVAHNLGIDVEALEAERETFGDA